ncbi:MAG: hypothetical protein WD768_05565 [Phycisphaeraceae bacterium]
MSKRPHKLSLYQAAVQHPQAEVSFLARAYLHYRGELPTRLREDFAGTCAVAGAWVQMHEDCRALAVESHGPTARWAQREQAKELGEAAQDLHIVEADVMALASPKVDVVCALNFSTFIYHDRAALLRYFKHARKCLAKNGLLVIDAYGGPGAMKVAAQRRRVEGLPCEYVWEQVSCNAIDARVDCRIHFAFDDGSTMKSAFRYDWRLWTLPELVELMREAGFAQAQVWCDQYDAKKGTSDGVYRPLARMNEREDWVAYVIGVK